MMQSIIAILTPSRIGRKQCLTKTKTKAPTTVILGNSILKNVYGYTISKATKFSKHIVVKHFFVAKINDRKHYMKPI